MPRRYTGSKKVVVSGVDSQPVTLSLQPSPLSNRDQLAVDLILEHMAFNGRIQPDVVQNLVQVADKTAALLEWDS